jgi:SAM-dependent methyltransferase
MADDWFALATLDHFWIKRRFAVFKRLAGSLIPGAREIAEVGCGHGLIQTQVEKSYSRGVTGLDLNDFALKRNQSDFSPVCCYDIHQRNPEWKQRFDLIFLFDVLEHTEDESQFLQSILFHLATDGHVIVNVPASQSLFSAYDVAAGHKRRYSISSLRSAAHRNQLKVEDWSYWGLPLFPALLLRKLYLLRKRGGENVISNGFDPRGPAMNRLLDFVSRCEPIPQKLLGTSLMAVIKPEIQAMSRVSLPADLLPHPPAP